MLLLYGPPRATASAAPLTPELAEQIGRTYQLAEVRPFLTALATQSAAASLARGASDASAARIAAALLPQAPGAQSAPRTAWGTVQAQLARGGAFRNSPHLRAEVEAALKTRLQSLLPELSRRYLYDQMLNGAFGAARPEVEALAGEVARRATTTINAQLDALAAQGYDALMAQLRHCFADAAEPALCPIPAGQFFTDPKAAIEQLLRGETLRRVFERPLAEALGEGTVASIRGRIETALSGELPPELLRALRQGPEQFRALGQRVRARLPGATLDRALQRVRDLPLLTIPNPVYGAILLASAGRHFANAFCGPTCFNPYEFKRATEVLDVLQWQLANREAIVLNLTQLLDLAKQVGAFAGLPPVAEWGKLGRDLTAVRDRVRKVRAEIGRMDQMVMGKVEMVGGKLDEAVRFAQTELQDLQQTLLTPVRDVVDLTNDGMATLRARATSIFPQEAGIPRTWAEFKRRAKLRGAWLGEWGAQTPLEVVGLEEVPGQVRAELARWNEAVSGELAHAAGGVLDATDLLPLTAQILPETRMPARHPSRSNAFDPVLLHNGEFLHRVVDLTIPARGPDLRFERVYRSRHDFTGPLGHNWTHTYNERLLFAADGAVVWFDAAGLKWRFARAADGTYQSPRGIFSILCRPDVGALAECSAAPFTLLHPDGTQTHFTRAGRWAATRDRFGNTVQAVYDAADRLVRVRDAVARTLQFQYDRHDRITQVQDWTGRVWRYAYDAAGDLVAVTSPATSAAPTGPTTRYAYSAHEPDPALNHNLVQIIDPKGQPYLRNTYGRTGLEQDRVIAQYYGDAARPIQAHYTLTRPGWWSGPGDAIDLVTVTDRRGLVRRYRHNAWGELVREESGDSAQGADLIAASTYDVQGRRTREQLPDGVEWVAEYPEPSVDRRGYGNVVQRHQRSSRGAVRSWRFTYRAAGTDVESIRDPLGQETTLHYDGVVPQAVMYPDGSRRAFAWDAVGQLQQIVDAGGVVTRYHYTTVGDVAAVVRDADGAAATTRYRTDRVGNVVAVTDPLGATTQFVLNPRNQVEREIGPAPFCFERRYTYDANDNLVRVAVEDRPRGFVAVEMGYDALDHLVRRREQVDAQQWIETRFEYDANEQLARVVRPEGNWVAFVYDARNRLLARQAGDDAVGAVAAWQWEYDAADTVVATVDPVGARTTYQYDAFGAIIGVRDPLGVGPQLERDPLGRVVAAEWFDRAGTRLQATRWRYDPRGRVVARQRAQWRAAGDPIAWITEAWERDALGRIRRFTDANGAQWAVEHDPLGRVRLVRDPVGIERHYTYDAAGNLTRAQVTPPLVETRFHYDPLGRLIAQTDPVGATWRYDYDARSNLVALHPPHGGATDFTYDFVGRLRARQRTAEAAGTNPWNPDGRLTTRYQWDGNHRLAAVFDDADTPLRYAYDPLDQLIGVHYADGTTTQYPRRRDGRVAAQQEASGRHTDYEYDPVGRLARLTARDAAGETRSAQYLYDPVGRLLAAQAEDEVSTFAYDALSHLVQETQGGVAIDYVVDPLGQVLKRRWPGAAPEQRHYDAVGRLASVAQGDARVVVEHAGWQRAVKTRFGAQLQGERVYDAAGRVRREWYRAGDQVVWSAEHQYDAAGNLITTHESHGPQWTYRYDGAQRLVGAERRDGGAPARWAWQLDGNDNRRVVTTPDGEQRYAFDALHRLTTVKWSDGATGVAVHYDADGRLVADNRVRYTYDPLGRLQRLRTAWWQAPIHYDYDALSRRVRRNGARIVYNGWQELGWQSQDGEWTALLRGGGLDALFAHRRGAAPAQYVLQDRLGSVRQTWSETGATAPPQEYTPDGAPLAPHAAADAAQFGFTGRPQEADASLVHLRYRDYAPTLARFLTRDPLGAKAALQSATVGVADGSRYQSTDHPGMGPGRNFAGAAWWYPAPPRLDLLTEPNLYTYAQANPQRYLDPFGLKITVGRDGPQVTIAITAEVLESPDLPSDFPELFETGVERIWNGTFPNLNDPNAPPWEVHTDVTLTRVPRWQQRGEHRIYPAQLNEALGVAGEVNRLGGRVMRIDPDIFGDMNLGPQERDVVYAHEVGHWLRLAHVDPRDPRASSRDPANLMREFLTTPGEVNAEGVDTIYDLLERYDLLDEGSAPPVESPADRSHWIRIRPDYKG